MKKGLMVSTLLVATCLATSLQGQAQGIHGLSHVIFCTDKASESKIDIIVRKNGDATGRYFENGSQEARNLESCKVLSKPEASVGKKDLVICSEREDSEAYFRVRVYQKNVLGSNMKVKAKIEAKDILGKFQPLDPTKKFICEVTNLGPHPLGN